jgi:hypothetical protein
MDANQYLCKMLHFLSLKGDMLAGSQGREDSVPHPQYSHHDEALSA